MESQPQVIDAVPAEPAKSKFPIWLIVVIVLVVVCCCAAVIVIAVLTMLGPTVGNVFSTINQSLP